MNVSFAFTRSEAKMTTKDDSGGGELMVA